MSAPSILTLDPWRCRQAAMLYHFAADDYLRPVLGMVKDLLAIADGLIDQSNKEGRDALLVDPQWGIRDTTTNWSTNAYPLLVGFRNNIVWLLAQRAAEVYGQSGYYETARALQEFSMQWSMPRDERQFNEAFEAIGRHCEPMDQTMDRQSPWNDFLFAITWHEVKGQFKTVPRFRVRMDVVGETGKRPPRTGVYVPADDPHGSLQFAWTGLQAATVGGSTSTKAGGYLTNCVTFNDLGVQALTAVGRAALWIDKDSMFDFASTGPAQLKESVFVRGKNRPNLAPSAVAKHAFVERPCKWYFVERIEGEYEDEPAAPPAADRMRAEPGAKVPRSGWWYTPAIKGEQGFRYFEEGSRFPDTDRTDWGTVVWQWDPERQPK